MCLLHLGRFIEIIKSRGESVNRDQNGGEREDDYNAQRRIYMGVLEFLSKSGVIEQGQRAEDERHSNPRFLPHVQGQRDGERRQVQQGRFSSLKIRETHRNG